MAVNIEQTSEELSGLRKVLQDFLAPELGGIKAMLASLHEGQQQMRQEMKDLRLDVKESQQELKHDMLRAIEVSANELKALMKASDAERRLADSERRNAELERRLSEIGRSSQASA